MKKFVDISIKITIVFFVLFSLIIFSAFWYFSAGLPDYKKLAKYQPPVSSRVYAKNGVLIAEYAVERESLFPMTQSQKIINSFLSAEDKIFFSHPGIDAKGIVRATVNNVRNIINDKRLEGASTITQQVAKTSFLQMKYHLEEK